MMPELMERNQVFPNPFRDGIVGDAWDSHAANDVTTIHQGVFNACLKAVHDVRHAGAACGVIVYGAAGSGKTHLIRRLREHLTPHFSTPSLHQLEQIFAYVRLDTSPHAISRHVRTRVATDLLRRSKINGVSQFELMVVARLMEVLDGDGDMLLYWDYLRTKPHDYIEDSLCELGERCGLSSTFIRVLVHLVTRRHRLDVVAWLRGESLHEEAYRRLGIGDSSDGDSESEALNVLRDFVCLGGDKLPLVLCFDQVEAIQANAGDTQALFAYGQLIRNLSNANKNLLLISCIQSALYSQLQTSLPAYQIEAIQSVGAMSLSPLLVDEAELLLKARLRAMHSIVDWPRDQGDLWPIKQEDLESWVMPHGTTPRRLLFNAAEQFERTAVNIDEPPRPDVNVYLTNEWERRFDASRRQRRAEQTVEVVRNALPDLIRVADPTWKVTHERIPGIDYVLEGPEREARVGVTLLSNSPQSLPQQLRTLENQVAEKNDLQKLVLLRDERLQISRKATVTHQRLDRLVQNDAVMHWLAPEVVAAIDAAHHLLAEAKAGDLSFQGAAVLVDTVSDWLLANMSTQLKQTTEVFLLQNTGKEEFVSELSQKLQEHMLKNWVCSVDQAAADLGVQSSKIVALAGKRPDLFGIVEGQPHAIFSARVSEHCLPLSPTDEGV